MATVDEEFRRQFEVGLFNDTLGPFLARNGGHVAHVNIDNDLYGGAKQALDDLAPRFFHGTRLHFHEIGDMKRGNVSAAAAASLATVQEECRALFDWLVARPCAHLNLVEIAEYPQMEAAVFVVAGGARTLSASSSAPCAAARHHPPPG